jgi:hypothetical protein
MKTLASLSLALLLTTACTGPRAFTRGSYEDPETIALLDDRFGENDMQLIARKIVPSLIGSPTVSGAAGSTVTVAIGRMRNRTTEHIDMQMLSGKIRTELIQSGRFRFVDVENRRTIAEEYDYHQSGYVDPAQAKGPGSQTGADYLLSGTLSSNVQQVGGDKLVYYKATFSMTDLLTSEIIWTDEKEVRKAYKKRSVRL